MSEAVLDSTRSSENSIKNSFIKESEMNRCCVAENLPVEVED